MKSYVRALLCALLVAGMVVLCNPAAMAQVNRATITGTVTDSSGAVIAGVEVTATNTGTNVPTKTASNGDGIYVIPNLFPGPYSVEFKKDGFETLVRPAVTLESTQVARIDAALKVGSVSQSMTVTADAPVLDYERPSEGTNLQGKVVTDLPLSITAGRDIESFAKAATPGYSPYSSSYGAVINGGQWFTKDYTIDGTSGTAAVQGNSVQNGPSMEAIQELQAQTSGLDAQSSITGGGIISFNLKSGTNQFHGTSFLYGVNELFNANTWTNDALGERKGKRRKWDYGFSAGGPIIKDKTFFFAAYERYIANDFRLSGTANTVPTDDFLNGDFSALLGEDLCSGEAGVGTCSAVGGTPFTVHDNAGTLLTAKEGMIFDPTTGNQFTGNVIPSGSISGVSQKIVDIFRQSYKPQFGGIQSNSRALLAGVPSETANQIVAKIDHVLREQDRLSGSWIYNRKPRILMDSGGLWQAGSNDGGPFSAARDNFFRSHQWRVSESHTISPTVLNVLRFTYNYDWQGDLPSAGGNWSGQLGFGSTGADNFPLISFGSAEAGKNGFNETFIGNRWQGNFAGAAITTGDTVTWTKGKHNFSFGGDFLARQLNSRAGSGALAFNFQNNTTGAPGQPYGDYVGWGFASFLLGEVSNADQTTAFNLYGRRKSLSLFGQDSYKVTPKLTLSLGLRWNYNFRFHEKYGHWANFDLAKIDPTYGVPGAVVFAKDGSDSFEKNEYGKNFGPQFGFAYSPWQKFVFRGAFSMIYNPPGIDFFQGVPNGFAPGFKGTNQATTGFNWDGGYPGVFTPGNKDVNAFNQFPIVSVDPRALKVGYSDAFNLGVQYELMRDMRVEASYIANRGHRLTDTSLAWNQGPTSTFLRLTQQYTDMTAWNYPVCGAGDAETFGITYPYDGFCGTALEAIAPYPQVANAFWNPYTYGGWYYPSLLYVGLPLGQSYYDSFVVDVVKRTGGGLTMDMSYTWSRQESNTFSAQQSGNSYYTGVQDFSNFGESAHNLTGYDLTHILKGYISYELPFGKGRHWLSNQNRWVNGILGGWNMTWLLRYNTGQPFQVGANNPYWPMWGNIYPNYDLSNYHGPLGTGKFVFLPPDYTGEIPAGNFYMPKDVASNPPAGQFGKGPATNGALRCPGSKNEDTSLLKYFRMGSDGRYSLSVRAEFFNVFNRHEYYVNGCAGSRSSIGSGDFGQILGVFDQPRTGQFGFRFEF
ncbi:MAG: TonB-dependent receptor [Acidobacteriia bacterium]|nr:TonB-dependent receptor [Terriglobia bacterium]